MSKIYHTKSLKCSSVQFRVLVSQALLILALCKIQIFTGTKMNKNFIFNFSSTSTAIQEQDHTNANNATNPLLVLEICMHIVVVFM